MDNNSLDKYIRNLLADLDGGNPANTWDQLREKMDDSLVPASADDLDFDDRIKASLVDLQAIEMADWENFASSLELAENLDHIDQDISLDANFKENLENLQVDYDPSTWPDLSSKLDLADVLEHENANQDLDQLAYDSLLNYTVPRRAGDWEALEEKLDHETVMSLPLLLKYKLAELGILTFLLLIFFQANPLVENNKQHNTLIANSPLTPQETVNPNMLDESETVVETAAFLVSTADNLNTKTKAVSSTQNRNSETKKKATANFARSLKIDSQSTTGTENVKSNTANTNIHLTDAIVLEISSDATPIIKGKDEQILKEKSKSLVIVDTDQPVRRFGLPVKTDELPFGSLMTLAYDKKGVQVCRSCFKPESILRWRIGAHIDAKYDYIMTAYDKAFNIDSYNHSTFGYGAGLSTSILLGKWEIESGFDFATRAYETRTGEIIGSLSNGYLKVRLDKIQMNVLSIPLNLRYHFKDQTAKTHFYVHAGATLNVATHVNYFIKSEFINNARRPPNPDAFNQLVEKSNVSTDKIYSLGWFDGGTYLPNRYYYANVGFGFERKISSRYSIFGQSTYSHYLDNRGIGPNDDRFNSISFSTGVRALFK